MTHESEETGAVKALLGFRGVLDALITEVRWRADEIERLQAAVLSLKDQLRTAKSKIAELDAELVDRDMTIDAMTDEQSET